MECALKMNGIEKQYDGVPILKKVDFAVNAGEIHALLGENGAGKTTLMNILGGITPLNGGSIELFGNKVNILNPAASKKNGVAFIHQELNVVNDLTVYENMFLGIEIHNKFGKIDAQKMIERTQEVFDEMHVDIDPREIMGQLQTSYKQIVEIAKSILVDAKLIIMDEPTTSLTRQEVENVFQIMRQLTKEHGVTIIFISHKLGEVIEFCDSYTVLRNGEKVCDGRIEDGDNKVSQADIARMMCGNDVMGKDVYEPHTIGETILDVKNLFVGKAVKNVSFSAKKGEILGFTGLLGDGKDELVRALFGDLTCTSGHIILNNQELTNMSPEKSKKIKIGYLPSNRKENAIIKDLSVQENMTIVTLEKCTVGCSIVKEKERCIAEDYKKRLNIKVENLANKITSLSGGNQQKVVLAKWLNAYPDLMILSNPTQGVDVGAKNEIYSLIMKLAGQGMSIIMTSSEAQEILKVCDRVLVMYHGELKGELKREELSEEALMILSTGGALDDEGGMK